MKKINQLIGSQWCFGSRVFMHDHPWISFRDQGMILSIANLWIIDGWSWLVNLGGTNDACFFLVGAFLEKSAWVLQWLVFLSDHRPHPARTTFVYYALLPKVLSTWFWTHPKAWYEIQNHCKAEGPSIAKQKGPPSIFWYFATRWMLKNPKVSFYNFRHCAIFPNNCFLS